MKRLPDGTKRPMEKALAILVTEGVLTKLESDDLQNVIALRNKIGHTIHELVEDISAPREIRRRNSIYDYFALKRFERYRAKISAGMMKCFVLSISFREVAFEQAEGAYKEELERLHKRIDKQFAARRTDA